MTKFQKKLKLQCQCKTVQNVRFYENCYFAMVFYNIKTQYTI